MKYYYKVIYGYGELDFVSIREEDLESATALFLTKMSGIVGGVPLKGGDIRVIKFDVHRTMDWPYSMKLTPQDWNEVRRIQGNAEKYQEYCSERAMHFVSMGKPELAGTDTDVPQIEDRFYPNRPALPQSGGGMKQISNIIQENHGKA